MHILHSSIFESPARTHTNPVNCVGVMGAGLARQFKSRYPEMYRNYRLMCETGLIRAGNLWIWHPDEGQSILCFPTKRHWRNPSRIEDIEAGLRQLARFHAGLGIESLALPALGCGLGGLHLSQVLPLMERYLDPLPIDVYLHLAGDDAVGRR